jgi:hypothetical protein
VRATSIIALQAGLPFWLASNSKGASLQGRNCMGQMTAAEMLTSNLKDPTLA